MQAFVLEKYSAPIQRVDMPVPTPRTDEVLVRVAAAGVNHADERVRSGEFRQIFPFELPMVMGSEFSGEVIGAGAEVADFALGSTVFGYADQARMGAHAEVIAVHQDNLAAAPESTTMTEAASLPVVWLTAWQAIVEMGDVQPGQTVLIHGGSGGVGSVAIQLAKHLGAVVATTASSKNADFVRELGADTVIDYAHEDFAQVLSDVDLVLDSQGGETLEKSLGVVRPGGLVIGITGPPDPPFADQAEVNPVVKLAIRGLSAKVRRAAQRRGVTYRFLFIQPNRDHLRRGAELVDAGVIRPQVAQVLPFAQTREALDVALSGGNRGKVLVSREDDPASQGDVSARPTTWNTAPTQRIESGGESLVYRELGTEDGTPVVLLTHLGATLDEWDPAVDFIQAMNLTQVDILGFSLGGFIAQQIALDHPQLVRRLVLTGTGPAGGRGIDRPTGAAYVYGDMLRGALARTDAKEFLFFNRDEVGKRAARDYLGRLGERVMDRDEPIALPAFRTQLEAIKAWGRAEPQDLSRIAAPTLIANGDNDRMVPSDLSEDMHRRIPDSTLEIYPNSGHGGIFQHGEAFTTTLLKHLAAE